MYKLDGFWTNISVQSRINLVLLNLGLNTSSMWAWTWTRLEHVSVVARTKKKYLIQPMKILLMVDSETPKSSANSKSKLLTSAYAESGSTGQRDSSGKLILFNFDIPDSSLWYWAYFSILEALGSRTWKTNKCSVVLEHGVELNLVGVSAEATNESALEMKICRLSRELLDF